MGRLATHVMVAALFAVFASLLAAPAAASGVVHHHGEPSFAPACHAASGLETTFQDMAKLTTEPSQRGVRWTCSDEDWVAHEPVAWLLFEREAWDGEERPRHFFTRIARYQSISFSALDADGTLRTLEWSETDGEPFPAGPVFRLDLPEIKAETHALIVRIERPHSVPMLTEARLAFYPDDADWSQLEVMILAFVLGMLVLPLFFDISFFIVLRERFVLLHAAMVVAMMGYVLSAGGLISVFDAIPLWVTAIAGPLFWAIGVGISALFLAEFLETHAQSRLMRRVTIGAGYWSILVPGFLALQLHATHGFDDRLYFYAFVPVILIITAGIAEAVGRGSRSARFLAFAWTPIILASIERLLRGIGAYVGPSSLDQGMFLATALEVIVVSLAIADRFLAIRRERDEARTEARMLEHLSERDALTGLLNRRGLEAQFEDLFKSGFDTFALIDLDRFKQVNDRHGHQVGDAALVACAKALLGQQDPDLVAARLGGEEFVVLLRGKRTLRRAEALRQSIPIRIAADVEGLDTPVTASSGAIGVPRATSARMSFDEFYARADSLMYDAKASGRNRMVSEKLTMFPARVKPAGSQGSPIPPRERRGRSGRDRRKGRAA